MSIEKNTMNDEPKTCPRCHSPEVEEHCGGEPGGLSYVELWKRHKTGAVLMVEATIGCNRMARAMAAAGISANKAADAFARLGDCMREAEKEESV